MGLSRTEKCLGLLADLRVPLDAIKMVEVVADARGAVRGMRAPGLGGWNRMIGTWRATGNKQYVCVRRHQPAVRLTFTGLRYQSALIGSDDAARIADEIRSAMS